jgi:hypothetical protein
MNSDSWGFFRAMNFSPIAILSAARKAVPIVDFALAVAGVAAAAAIVGFFISFNQTGIIVLSGTFVAMILLYVFSILAASNSKVIAPAGIIVVYAVIFFFCTFLFLTITSFVANWPPAFAQFLGILQSGAADIGDPAIPRRLADVHTAELRATNVDDFLDVYVNDNAVIERATYGAFIPWRSFRPFLKQGKNEIRAVVKNGDYGGCGANLQVRINGAEVESLNRAWSIPMERASAGGICVDEAITFDLR